MKKVTLLAKYWSIASDMLSDVNTSAKEALKVAVKSLTLPFSIYSSSCSFTRRLSFGLSRNQSSQTTAQITPISPLTPKVQRHPIFMISHGIRNSEKAAPSRLPEKLMPCARPRSFTGNHLKKACAAPGNAPASPTPNRNLRINIWTAFLAAPVRAVNTLQTETTRVSALRGPNLSAIHPAGTWKSAYPMANIPRTNPMVSPEIDRSLLICSTAEAMQARSIYVLTL